MLIKGISSPYSSHMAYNSRLLWLEEAPTTSLSWVEVQTSALRFDLLRCMRFVKIYEILSSIFCRSRCYVTTVIQHVL